MLQPYSPKDLRAWFGSLSHVEADGTIPVKYFCRALKDLNVHFTKGEIEGLLHHLDIENVGR
jgi:hypothetical protein